VLGLCGYGVLYSCEMGYWGKPLVVGGGCEVCVVMVCYTAVRWGTGASRWWLVVVVRFVWLWCVIQL